MPTLYQVSTPKDMSELFYEAQRLAGEPVEITFAPVPFPLSQVNDGITVTLRTLAEPQHAISPTWKSFNGMRLAQSILIRSAWRFITCVSCYGKNATRPDARFTR